MTAQQISKVWTVVSLLLVYYALNTWIVTQGGQEIFGAKLVVSSRIPAALIGIPICAILLMVCSLIGIRYARRAGPAWHERIPVVGFDAIETGSPEGKCYQRAMISLLSLLPLIALIHFWHLVCSARVATTSNPPKAIDSVWSWSALTSLNDPARICTQYNFEPHISCEGSTTILPGLEPTIFAVITVAAVITMGFHWWVLFCRK